MTHELRVIVHLRLNRSCNQSVGLSSLAAAFSNVTSNAHACLTALAASSGTTIASFPSRYDHADGPTSSAPRSLIVSPGRMGTGRSTTSRLSTGFVKEMIQNVPGVDVKRRGPSSAPRKE